MNMKLTCLFLLAFTVTAQQKIAIGVAYLPAVSLGPSDVTQIRVNAPGVRAFTPKSCTWDALLWAPEDSYGLAAFRVAIVASVAKDAVLFELANWGDMWISLNPRKINWKVERFRENRPGCAVPFSPRQGGSR